jgi:hypothetical protein
MFASSTSWPESLQCVTYPLTALHRYHVTTPTHTYGLDSGGSAHVLLHSLATTSRHDIFYAVCSRWVNGVSRTLRPPTGSCSDPHFNRLSPQIERLSRYRPTSVPAALYFFTGFVLVLLLSFMTSLSPHSLFHRGHGFKHAASHTSGLVAPDICFEKSNEETEAR